MRSIENDISESFDRAKALEEKLGVMHTLKGLKIEYDDCYSYMEDADEAISGMCSGMICGTEETDYVLEKCIDCPYYVGNKGETKDEDLRKKVRELNNKLDYYNELRKYNEEV